MPKSRPKGRVLPEIWKSGPDEINHRLYTDCQRARAQARYRGEDWQITEQEYIDLWRQEDRYLNKGRTAASICMCRRDAELPWTTDNIDFVLRIDHLRSTNQQRFGTTYKKRKKHAEPGL
jgi:hypothetical protein